MLNQLIPNRVGISLLPEVNLVRLKSRPINFKRVQVHYLIVPATSNREAFLSTIEIGKTPPNASTEWQRKIYRIPGDGVATRCIKTSSNCYSGATFSSSAISGGVNSARILAASSNVTFSLIGMLVIRLTNASMYGRW